MIYLKCKYDNINLAENKTIDLIGNLQTTKKHVLVCMPRSTKD